jgi:hypothetical protein
MRIFIAFLIILAVLYFWDVEYNHGTLSIAGTCEMPRVRCVSERLL